MSNPQSISISVSLKFDIEDFTMLSDEQRTAFLVGLDELLGANKRLHEIRQEALRTAKEQNDGTES